jgi:hypothetical protein
MIDLRALLIAIALAHVPSASAEGTFVIGTYINNLSQLCDGISTKENLIAPKHCFENHSDKKYIYEKKNPITAIKIESTHQPKDGADLVILHTTPAIPPIGEGAQGGALLCHITPLSPPLFVHSCNDTVGGQSGTLVTDGHLSIMHLGLIKINGQTLGFGIDYSSIIKDNQK